MLHEGPVSLDRRLASCIIGSRHIFVQFVEERLFKFPTFGRQEDESGATISLTGAQFNHVLLNQVLHDTPQRLFGYAEK